MNSDVMEEIKESIPKSAEISDTVYEGSEIILYTKNRDFFRTCTELIRSIVNRVKKRIEVRADPSILVEEEKTKEFIRKTVPQEAEIKDIYFEPEFAKVVIHAEKPGLAIGKNGETLNTIKEKTFWTPDIKRAPVIDSVLVKSVRKMLHEEVDYRKKFLNNIGKKIYAERGDVDWVRLTCLGSFREVGRSCMLLQTPESRVLLDCGVSVSSFVKPYPYLDAPEFHIQDLDAVILSHAHLDHCGLVPYLYEYGYKGPMYCTRPTRDLSVLLQLDYIGICQRENKKAPYSSKAIEDMVKHCVPLEYGEVTDITPDMRITLQNAGHLMGSSSVHIHVGEGLFNLLYTADIKYETTKLFERASTDYQRIEAVIIESTYGGSSDSLPSHRDGEQFLADEVKRTIERGGRVLIPSFAVGRGQDVVAILADTDIDVPIYQDGMVWDATAIHTAYPEFMSRAMQTKILHKGKNPFIDPRLRGIGSSKERQEIFNTKEPCVVIATSGMLMGGPALEYLQQFAGDPKNTLLFVGYQAEGSLGRRIQKGWREIQMENGKTLELKMEIATVQGLSGHSDQRQLLSYLSNLSARPKRIMTNHGDNMNCVDLAKTLHRIFKVETMAPKNLETIRFK